MATTRTGSFPIGFRRGWSPWQKDLTSLISFAQANDFAALDTGALPAAELRQITDAGLSIGSVDLPGPWTDLASPDAGKRNAAADAMAAYVKEVAPLGVRNFFTVIIPEDHARRRSENLDFAVDGYGKLCEKIADANARIVIEGYPGGAPHYSSLACTPADYRLFFDRVGSPVLAVNFDPSHLIRMGIDPVRFVREFGDRIEHVHGKDTEIIADELYLHGHTQPATEAKPHGFGGHGWRYTLPGHGVAPWGQLFTLLAAAGYDGAVCIELEDENFNGTEEGEKRGLIASREFLENV